MNKHLSALISNIFFTDLDQPTEPTPVYNGHPAIHRNNTTLRRSFTILTPLATSGSSYQTGRVIVLHAFACAQYAGLRTPFGFSKNQLTSILRAPSNGSVVDNVCPPARSHPTPAYSILNSMLMLVRHEKWVTRISRGLACYYAITYRLPPATSRPSHRNAPCLPRASVDGGEKNEEDTV